MSRDDRTALALALALGPARRYGWPWPEDLERWFRDSWKERDRYAAWRAARCPRELLSACREIDRKTTARGARIALIGEQGYPAQLLQLQPPPPLLFIHGSWPPPRPMVAIVGSRAARRRCCQLAAELAREAHRLGYGVISGGAIGIDTAAHRGCLAAGGCTVAVLGSGLERPYPDRNRSLFDTIAASGALLTPFSPTTPPRRANFPQRNALIAALAELTIVVEAAHRSGALSTARCARKRNVPVAACPTSSGCARLIATGAWPLRQPADLGALLAGRPPPAARPDSPAARRLCAVLSRQGELDLDTLARQAGLDVPTAAAELMRLEVGGHVICVPGGRYRLVSFLASGHYW